MKEKRYKVSDWRKGKVEAEKHYFSATDWESIRYFQQSLFDKEVERRYRDILNSFHFMLESAHGKNDFITATQNDLDTILNGWPGRNGNLVYSPLLFSLFYNDRNPHIPCNTENKHIILSIIHDQNKVDYGAIKRMNMRDNLQNNPLLNTSASAMALNRFIRFFDDFMKIDPMLWDSFILKEKKNFPDFPELFRIRNEFDRYISRLEDEGYIVVDPSLRDMRWIAMKVYFVSFLYQLHDSCKLKIDLYANNLQNLGRIAMLFFHIAVDKRTLARGYYYQTRKEFSFI